MITEDYPGTLQGPEAPKSAVFRGPRGLGPRLRAVPDLRDAVPSKAPGLPRGQGCKKDSVAKSAPLRFFSFSSLIRKTHWQKVKVLTSKQNARKKGSKYRCWRGNRGAKYLLRRYQGTLWVQSNNGTRYVPGDERYMHPEASQSRNSQRVLLTELVACHVQLGRTCSKGLPTMKRDTAAVNDLTSTSWKE